MSFFRRLLGGEPQQLIDKAQRALADGQAASAMDLFKRAKERSADEPELADKAEAGIGAASEALVKMNLEEATLAEEADDPEGAMSHLETALELCVTDRQRKSVESRMDLIEDAAAVASEHKSLFNTEGAVGIDDELPEERWDRLLATLVDEIAEDYEERDTDFRDALLALDDGRPEAALEVLDKVIDEDPDDPLARFERGRALLALERLDEAVADLAAAREEIGFDPLDRAGMLQIAVLEADALLTLRRGGAARDLLNEALEDQGESVGLLFLRARAEMALGELDSAEDSLQRVVAQAPQLVEATILLAELRIRREEMAAAAEVLEEGIKRHCGTGTCQVRPVSVPAARLLARCYLDMEKKLPQTEDLLLQIRGSLEGHVTWGDHVLWGRLHRLKGNTAAYEESREAALSSLPEGDPKLRELVLGALGEPEA